MIDLNNFSLSQLRDLQTQVAAQIEVRQQQDVETVRQQILSLAESVGMTVEQIVSLKVQKVKKATKSVAARYQNPDDAKLQWTGRGRKPRWVTEYLEKSGKKLDSQLIA